MTKQEQEAKLEEAKKLADLIEVKTVRARTIKEDWGLLENRITDYVNYLEHYEDFKVEPELMEYLDSYIKAEYKRLTRLEGNY